ncbi:MAG TPA: DUF3383 family protein [Leptospiraceae bacterium]|nr:DUF3383 family protein [Leptospiraceae bacterium]
MNQINNINVGIGLATLPISQKGFGMPLIAGTTQPSSLDLIGAVNHTGGYVLNDSAIVVDGFADSGNPIAEGDQFTIAGETGSPVHTVVSASKTAGNTTGITFTPALAGPVADNAVITVTKETDDVYFEITDADELLLLGYSASDPEYKMAAAMFSQSPRIETLAVFYIPSFSALPTETAKLRNKGKDAWYYFLITSRLKADIAIADAYINSLKKFGVFGTSDQTVTSTGDRTFILISNHADEYPDAGVVGRCAAEPVGSITFDSKQISGQKNSDVTMSEQSTLLAQNFNLIRDMGGVNVLWEGKMMGGQYADVIIGRDWLEARLIESLQSLKINSKKIPMDGRGIKMIESSIRSVFINAGKAGVIAPVISEADRLKSDLGDYQYKLSMPEAVSDIAQNDRANRLITPITFTAVVGGGINKMTISGTMEA